MATEYDVEASLTLRENGFGSGFKKASSAVDDFTSKTEKSGGRVGKAWDGMSKGVKTLDGKINAAFGSIAKVAAVGFAAVGVAAVGFGVAAIKSAADLNAMNAQYSQVFGDMESQATESLNGIAKQTNILPNRLKGAYTQIAAFAKTAGMDTAQALDLSSRATMAAADSAAFYDRSISDVTESIQSYLKGNYENDASLGISSTETTRNAAANKLYGKSFIDLSEDQKQFTLLDMIEQGNKTSGALGQAAREGTGLENVMGNLKQNAVDLAAKMGMPFLDPLMNAFNKLSGVMPEVGAKIDAFFQSAEGQAVIQSFSDTVGLLADKFVAFIQNVDIESIASKMVQFTQSLAGVDWGGIVGKIGELVGKFIEFAPAIIPVVKGVVAFVVAIKAMSFIVTIVNFVTMLVNGFMALIPVFSAVGGVITTVVGILGGPLTVAILAIIAVVALLVANWETVKKVASDVWNAVVEAWSGMWSAISKFVGEMIVSILKFVFDTIQAYQDLKEKAKAKFNEMVQAIVVTILKFILDVINKWEELKNKTAEKIAAIVQGAKDGFGKMVRAVKDKIQKVKDTVTDGIGEAVDVVTGFGSKFKEAGGALVGMIADGIKGAVKKVTGAIDSVVGAVRDFLPFSPAKTGPLSDLDKLNFGGTISTGIYNGEREVQSAMSDILTMPALSDLSGTIGDVSKGLSQNINTNLSVNRPIYVKVDSIMDGKKVGEGSAPYVKTAISKIENRNSRNRGY